MSLFFLPREFFLPAERENSPCREKKLFISRQRAPKGQLSIVQGIALGIRHLRTMRPVRAALMFHCFLQLPLAGRVGCLFPFTYGDALGYGRYWTFLFARTSYNYYRLRNLSKKRINK